MCGIAGFLSNGKWKEKADLGWLKDLSKAAEDEVQKEEKNWAAYLEILDKLGSRFDDLMSFSTHWSINTSPPSKRDLETILSSLKSARQNLVSLLEQGRRNDYLEGLNEKLEDYIWQIEWEVLGNVDRVGAILPDQENLSDGEISVGYLAWGIEQTLESLDKLEIRGRDSAGVSILFTLEQNRTIDDFLDEKQLREFEERSLIGNASNGHTMTQDLDEGRVAVRFVFKVANLVGKLGDNGATIRRRIRTDKLLWRLAAGLTSLNIISHTRWASNGVINVENCHPVDGEVIFDSEASGRSLNHAARTLFVLNGDVDNYHGLVETSVLSRSARIDRAISTDAKILPVLYALERQPGMPAKAGFRDVMQRSHGSLAVAMQSPAYPNALLLAQKGSGQSLYVGKTKDGLLVASEAYGLASRCRVSYPMTTTEVGGATVALEGGNCSEELAGEYLAGGGKFDLKPEPIEIFSRDVFRKGYDYYIEKEIHEAPDSVRKTIQGKYEKTSGGVVFAPGVFGNSERLLQRLTYPDSAPVRRIYLIGMGTASIAAMGAESLIRRSIQGSGIIVDSLKSSELVGFMQEREMDDTLIIAISQSGTTTDTNRVVDLAREKGAWIHAIVNRRNSPLARKSDSYLYTGNGRDVEMSVASTKAYYSQVAAGKLLALWMASALGAMGNEEIRTEIESLESLPRKINEVLEMREIIGRYAQEDGLSSRYWAVVGNGANRVAAEEIRIKLSELCYKSIPCDVTEDKKHIDLSTEPFTIVVANDLPEMVAQDTVKEVVIFKAHNGRPMVICAQGETRFDPVAEKTLKLPRIGGGLAFVLATVAGHLWGVEAAKAIDRSAGLFRELRNEVAKGIEDPAGMDHRLVMELYDMAIDFVSAGRADSALPANVALSLAVCWRKMASFKDGDGKAPEIIEETLDVLNKVVEESTRTIDTIRHQAKTVTVGISRPQKEISPLVLDALRYLDVSPQGLSPQDRKLLEALSPVVIGLEGCLLYEVIYDSPAAPNLDKTRIRAIKGLGSSSPSDSKYFEPRLVRGTKRRALRTGRMAFSGGPEGVQNALLAPVFEGPTPTCSHEVLMHLLFAGHCSLQQKMDILHNLGSKYEELEEMTHELNVAEDVGDVLNHTKPRDLVFCSVKEILENYESAGT